ncbi:MFS transporter [Streptomyces sp. AcH 505]|jgi:ACS family D-galactonate transporter-like MFS transporter|uniref:MFS transporter n=1 Tax=Streptomyces sp. AcH 505 TaxID=352211 RepID=UPI000B1E4B2D
MREDANSMAGSGLSTYNYKRLWIWLCIGWMVSSADRVITGPVVTWMIEHKVAFMATEHPYALGGLIGSIFFAGYMLTQFPGGYAGDRHGHRTVLAISLFAAAVATLVSGLAAVLVVFIAARILTGLGEGLYYANDRTIIAETTPLAERSLAMGVVMIGLSVGITFATLGGAWIIEMSRPWLGDDQAWRMPFFVLAILSFAAAVGLRKELWRTRCPRDNPAGAAKVIGAYSAIFFVLIFGVFLLAQRLGLPGWGVAALELLLALGLIAYVYRSKAREISGAIHDTNLLLLYLAAIAVLWNLWFFGFWAISIVSAGADGSFLKAALTAMFTGVAGLIGFPLGGWIADRAVKTGFGRKRILVVFTFAQGLLTLCFAIYIHTGGNSLLVMAFLLFAAGLFFSALQPVSHAMTADIARPEFRGSAFGMWNLVGEIGAVLSPVVSGTLRDAYNSWVPAVYLDAAIILASCALLLFVREALPTKSVARVALATD